MSRERLACAAGLFNGEGCFYARLAGSRQYAAAISNTDLELLKEFQAAVGFGGIYGPYARTNRERHRQSWQWRANSGERIQALGAMLWPWLSRDKRERLKAALVVWKQPRRSEP